ncbi:FAD:protein FMN transferase [Roseivirga sp.]|uniref:FAD:protein FMN transferase n=1 Tax=Roseivirga sp. TaxID=1964215 RepID=UPI002B274E74|nr:FAD:protein FMN transferase [Roseivirga sp.]
MDKNQRSRIYLLVLVIAIFVVWKYRENQKPKMVLVQGTTMGVIAYNIKYIDEDLRNFKKEIDSLLIDFNQSLSTYIPDSEISIFNKEGKATFNFPYFSEVLIASQEVYKASGGYFDPTVGPLVDAWGFGDGKSVMLDSGQVDSVLKYVGFEKVKFTSEKVFKSIPELKLNFSAIAKGQAIDVIAEYLMKQNIENFMVEIGGEVRAKGKNDSGETWTIGIEVPDENRVGGVFDAIQLENHGMATSGNYRNYKIVDGKKVAHTIDPKTGYPKMITLLSATIVAPTCMYADAYATASMAMGLDKAKAMVESNPSLEAYFIYSDQDGNTQTYISSGLKGKTINEQ